jgi:Mce-associated membrane protein
MTPPTRVKAQEKTMSTVRMHAVSTDSSERPEPADEAGEENLHSGGEDASVGAEGGADQQESDSAHAEAPKDATSNDDTGPVESRRGRLAVMTGCVVLPAVALLLGGTAGYLKWLDGSGRDADVARAQSVRAAVDTTVAMLSYRPANVTQNLAAARDRMTGAFRDSYTSLTTDVVIPGAKQRQISAVATVPAAASVSATPTHAVVLVFVNQTTTIGNDPPSDTASRVKVTLEKVRDRWLISAFDPI